MTKLNKLSLALAMAAGMAAVVPAHALSLSAGDFKFNIDNYDAGTTGYGAGTPICNSTASCDASSGIVAAPGAIGSEDTWGIFSIQSITRISDNALFYSVGQGGKYLTGVFGGGADELVFRGNFGFPPVDTTVAFANGGWFKLYENTANYAAAQGPAGRLGTYGYSGITDIGGNLLLDAVFAGSANGTYTGYSYMSTFNSTSFAGAGQGFMDIIGGSWQSMLDTNSLMDAAGNMRDLSLDVTYADQNGAASAIGWSVTSAGQVKGQSVPEPATLALLGLGLIGLASMRRRA